jgi:predicted RNA-binding Zn-ribbon protein involved in translation (DUF1610 family)
MVTRDRTLFISQTYSLTMNCPKCGQEMEEGFIQAGAGIFLVWTDKLKIWAYHGTDIIAEAGFHNPHLKGHRCSRCRIIVSEY